MNPLEHQALPGSGQQQAPEQAWGRAGDAVDAGGALLLRMTFWTIRLQRPSRH